MTWEPMTEDAVFEDRERIFIATLAYGEPWYDAATYYKATPTENYEVFRVDYGVRRSDITHFARITNPNEEKP